MHSFYTFVGLVLPAAVLAQYDYGGGSTATSTAPASETTGNANVHTVQVGPGGRFVYDPEEITAAVGDKVEFFFNPLNHTVTKSTFDAPCVPAESNAIFSGFMPVPAGSEGDEKFTITITDERPIWLYCSQNTLRHCQSGMAMVINPPQQGPNTLEAYKAAAALTETSQAPPAVVGGLVASVDEEEDGDDAPPSGTGSAPPQATDNAAWAPAAALAFAGAPAALAMLFL